MMEKELIFRNWVTEHSDELYRFALQRLHDQELCKDLLQEAFLAAWRNIDSYKGQASVKNWLFIILKRKITDHYRKAHTRLEVEMAEYENDPIFFDEQDHWKQGMYPRTWSIDFDNRVELKEFQHVFHSCGKKLNAIQNSVFVMKYVDCLNSEEICKELQITSANYWVLLHRAKVRLRACLEKNWIQK